MHDKKVSQPLGSPPESSHGPSLAEVQRDPTLLENLSAATIVTLRRHVSYLAADLDTAFYKAMTRVKSQDPCSEATSDRLLTPEAAAARFGVTKRWLLDHADQFTGVRRLSRKVVRFSERHLERFFNRPSI
jgi:hypothetical protein